MANDKAKFPDEINIDEDIILMQKAADDDTNAFEYLYHKYYPVLKKELAKHDDKHMSYEDLIQEVFTRLWQQRNNYEPKSCFNTYLLAIARHTINEKIRKSQRIEAINLERLKSINRNLTLSMSQPEAESYFRELITVLKDTKEKLTTAERQALEKSLMPDWSLEKASEELSCSQEAIRCRVKRVRKRLRKLLHFEFRK